MLFYYFRLFIYFYYFLKHVFCQIIIINYSDCNCNFSSKNLDLWTLRVSWLELEFMYKQCENQSPPQINTWLDSVAKATIDVFQMMSEENQNPIKGEALKNCSPSK